MSLTAGKQLLLSSAAAAASGYTISRSLRFNSADSAYLSRTPASAGNRKTWTWAGWVKRSKLGTAQYLMIVEAGFDDITSFFFDASNKLNVYIDPSTAGITTVTTSAVYRDCSAWYHVVIACDTTQATAANRVKIYVNGSEQALTGSYPAQNVDTYINSTTAHPIGIRLFNLTGGLDAYLADVYLVDGQALDPTSFGEFSATTGVWMPKAFTGSYGTNGFKLDFADNSAATAAALGKDTSGNGNNFTPTNLSVTAGAGNDSLVDVPVNGSQTDTGVGGEVRGNYCTLNPLIPFSGTLSNGNLDAVTPASNSTNAFVYGTFCIPTSGKWYWEYVPTANGWQSYCGIGEIGNASSKSVIYYANSGQKYVDGSASAYGATYGDNDVIGVAVDAGAGLVTFYKNNSSQGAISYSVASGIYSATLGDGTNSLGVSLSINFGQRPFAYTAPSGFKALCTANLPAPTIVKPSTVMDVVLYTGTGSTLTPTSSLGFSPDLVWIKSRSAATDNTLYDAVRGAQARLESNNTDAEVTSDNGLTAFNSAGFTLGTLAQVNTNAATYAAWTWDAGSSTVTNTAGTITSSVRANASAGFSVVTASVAGGLNSPTIGHGLGVTPGLIIAKSRNEALSWYTWHSSFSSGDYILLNSTAAKANNSNSYGTVNSSIFTIGGTNTSTIWVSGSTGNYVFYCFAPVAGYSAFGSYTGNGSADGPFVYTGFRPRWVIVKRSDSTSNWSILDSTRKTFNVTDAYLDANATNIEYSGVFDWFDFLSNGFKARAFNTTWNVNGATYVWAAFAESPFQYSRAR
jgi:hypothetical protein